MTRKKRILFFAEPATLAHVARPVVLAGALDAQSHEVAVATGPEYQWVVGDAGLKALPMHAIGSVAYLDAVAAGRPVFPLPVLEDYVDEDLRLMRAFEPDLVVGDFRLSLAVSARLAKLPYVAISNAYWSPFAPVRFEVPVHPLTRMLGPGLVDAAFRIAHPLVLALHSLPMHRLRRRHGMPSLGFDLRSVFTEADLTVFADVPALVPTRDSGSIGRYAYIGPVTWSPDCPLPAALEEDGGGRPLVYLTLGSSGDPGLLVEISRALVALDCRVAIALGPGAERLSFPAGVVVERFLPGAALSRRASLVICNGGSPTTHQALREGTPVLGIPQNLDQMLNMQFIVATGAGLALRADRITADRVAKLTRRLLEEPSFRHRAGEVAGEFARYPCGERFAEVIRGTLEASLQRASR